MGAPLNIHRITWHNAERGEPLYCYQNKHSSLNNGDTELFGISDNKRYDSVMGLFGGKNLNSSRQASVVLAFHGWDDDVCQG